MYGVQNNSYALYNFSNMYTAVFSDFLIPRIAHYNLY